MIVRDEVPMGQINLICDESWRAARLVAKRLESHLDDAELVEAVHVVRAIVAESMRRLLERTRREDQRLYGLHRLKTQDSHGVGSSEEGDRRDRNE
jgi:hypothetical protein